MKEIDKKLIETISRYAASGIDQQVANLEKRQNFTVSSYHE